MQSARRVATTLSCKRFRGIRTISTTTFALKDADPLSALFEEMEGCDTSTHSQANGPSAKLEEGETSRTANASPPPTSDARVRLEEAKQRRLKRQLKDVGEELNALLREKSRTVAQEANKSYVPAPSAKTFLSSAELIQEKAPQEFVVDEKSAEELAKVPSLQHSGCSAVITMVGVVTRAPEEVRVVLPGDESESTCVEFAVRYEIPFAQTSTAMVVTVRTVGATLSTFVRQNVGVSDVVHVLGHLAPFNAAREDGSLCAVYVLPAGGNISVVLSGTAI